MKAGQVYKYKAYFDVVCHYIIVEDYGTLRPLIIDSPNEGPYMNASMSHCQLKKIEDNNCLFYKDSILVAKSLEDFYRKKLVS